MVYLGGFCCSACKPGMECAGKFDVVFSGYTEPTLGPKYNGTVRCNPYATATTNGYRWRPDPTLAPGAPDNPTPGCHYRNVFLNDPQAWYDGPTHFRPISTTLGDGDVFVLAWRNGLDELMVRVFHYYRLGGNVFDNGATIFEANFGSAVLADLSGANVPNIHHNRNGTGFDIDADLATCEITAIP